MLDKDEQKTECINKVSFFSPFAFVCRRRGKMERIKKLNFEWF